MSDEELATLTITELRRWIAATEEQLSLCMIRRDAISNPLVAASIKRLNAELEQANDRLAILRAAGRGKRPERRKPRADDADTASE